MNKIERTSSLALAAVASLAASGAQAAVVGQPVAAGATSVSFGAADSIDFVTGTDFLPPPFGAFSFLDANASGQVQVSSIAAGGTTIDSSRAFGSSTEIDGFAKHNVGNSLYLPFELTGGAHPEYGFVTLDVSQSPADGTFSYVLESTTLEDSGAAIVTPSVSAVPEPSSLALLAAGALGLAAFRRRQRG